jgi:hypothetical protein
VSAWALNSIVRARMRSSIALLLAVLLPSCAGTPTHAIAAAQPACYWSTDGVRYNHFSLRLNPDLSFQFKLIGDIGTWAESSGTWARNQQDILLAQESALNRFDIAFPATLKILGNGSLRFKYDGAFYSSGGTDLVPSKCEPQGFSQDQAASRLGPTQAQDP